MKTAGREVALRRVLHLLQQLLAVADQLLDRQRADDRSQRTLEDVLDDGVDLLGLGVEEALGRVAQRLDVASDLERGHALHLDLDALAGDSVAELDVDLPRRQLQPADPVEERHDDRAAADDHLHALVARMRDLLAPLVVHLGAARAGDDDRLVRAGHLVAAGDEGKDQHEDYRPGHHDKR